MNIAIIGCGFVADFYVHTLRNYPSLHVLGVYDINVERGQVFSKHYKLHLFDSYQQILDNAEIDLIVNLTNPRSHFEVCKAALLAGKHVWSEKPLTMEQDHAIELYGLANQRNLMLSVAPCSLLGEAAQTIWHSLLEGKIGTPRVIYAAMEDDMLHKMNYRRWKTPSGAYWPWKDEFEVGCTVEHAGYYLSWFPAFFGPAVSVTAFSDCIFPEKNTDLPLSPADTPDFSIAIIKFASGAVARLSTGICAPHDHSLQIIGDEGMLVLKDGWNYDDPVYLRKWFTFMGKRLEWPFKKRIPFVKRPTTSYTLKASHRMEFSRGIYEMSCAVKEGRLPILSNDFCLHVNELTMAIHHAGTQSPTYMMKTTFAPMQPLGWETRNQTSIKR
jgi:predicted dehydrogenase